MTIGIAAKAPDHSCIVTVSDRAISFDDEVPRLDSAVMKDWMIGPTWGILFAANDICFTMPIINRVGHILIERGRKYGLPDVKRAVCDAYAEVRRHHIWRQHLSKFGIESLDELKALGPSRLGSKLFWSLARRVDGERLEETTFLVYGYDPDNKMTAHLFEVLNPGVAFDFDQHPYRAIGSGAQIAIASLNMRPISHLTPAQLIYRVLEAKFTAENSSHVGTATTVFIANRNEPTTLLSTRTIELIRDMWKRSRMEPPSADIDKLIIEIKLSNPGA